MRKLNTVLNGTSTEVVHTVKVQMGTRYDPERLEAELHRRARGEHPDNPAYGAGYSHLVQADGAQCYNITFVNEKALPVIYDILAQIDADVGRALEQTRLVGLLAEG